MTIKELDKVLKNHLHWIREDCKDWENMRANLRGANLCGAALYGANLCGADLREADLREAEKSFCYRKIKFIQLSECDGTYL